MTLVTLVPVCLWETTLPYRGKLHITQALGYAEDKSKIIIIKKKFSFSMQVCNYHLLIKRRSLTFSMEVINTELPIRTNIMRPVKRCSLMPKNLGCSPGAEHSDSNFRLFTWLIDSTVAATNHGRPMREHTPSITPTTNRSRWYPQPFCGCTHTQRKTCDISLSVQDYLLTKRSILWISDKPSAYVPSC